MYVRCGTYAAQHLTDGFVPEQVALQYGTPALAATLVQAKLWRRTRGGWRMPDYLEYNPSKEAVDKERKAAAERQKRRREAMASRRDSPRDSHDPVPARPGFKTADVVNRTNGSMPWPPELIESIIREVRDVTSRSISDEWACRVASELLKGRTPANPVAYVRQAIRNDPNPRLRFLPLY